MTRRQEKQDGSAEGGGEESGSSVGAISHFFP